jgi:hypothetical protein
MLIRGSLFDFLGKNTRIIARMVAQYSRKSRPKGAV